MTAQEIQHALTDLGTIQADARQLRAAVAEQAPHLDIQPALTRIWVVSMDLQRRLCTRTAVEGFREDALDQVARVSDLIREYDGSGDWRQLASIGYACDLAADKIKQYQRMDNLAAQMEVLTGEPIMEGA